MAADLVARLEVAAENWPTVYESDRANVALLREAASALRSSGEAVAWINPQVLSSITRYKFLERVNHRVRLRSIPHPGENSIPLYLHPATVTDEDVERAKRTWYTYGISENERFRAALESFVRKQPAASAALERV